MVLRCTNRHSPLRHRCRPGRPCSGNTPFIPSKQERRSPSFTIIAVHSLTALAFFFLLSNLLSSANGIHQCAPALLQLPTGLLSTPSRSSVRCCISLILFTQRLSQHTHLY